MRFHVRSYRNGLRLLQGSPGYSELAGTIESLTVAEVDRRRKERQTKYDADARAKGKDKPTKAGVQAGLNELFRERLGLLGWTPSVAVFDPDPDTNKGFWVMDFAKKYEAHNLGVGLEITFNHGEALTWTPIRLTLAHEAEGVRKDARINVGCIVMGTDQLKGSSRLGARMDPAVGTFERLVTLIPKMRSVLPAPLVIFGLDWADGGLASPPLEISLHTSRAGATGLLGQ